MIKFQSKFVFNPIVRPFVISTNTNVFSLLLNKPETAAQFRRKSLAPLNVAEIITKYPMHARAESARRLKIKRPEKQSGYKSCVRALILFSFSCTTPRERCLLMLAAIFIRFLALPWVERRNQRHIKATTTEFPRNKSCKEKERVRRVCCLILLSEDITRIYSPQAGG